MFDADSARPFFLSQILTPRDSAEAVGDSSENEFDLASLPESKEIKFQLMELDIFLVETCFSKPNFSLLKGAFVNSNEFQTSNTMENSSDLTSNSNSNSILKSNSDLVPSVYEGGFKLWECTMDLLQLLYKKVVEKEEVVIKGRNVLELGCGHGLPGIFCVLHEAKNVHFQDFNEEVLRRLTIPNLQANWKRKETRKSPSIASDNLNEKEMEGVGEETQVKFIAGDWACMDSLLFVRKENELGRKEKENNDGKSKESCIMTNIPEGNLPILKEEFRGNRNDDSEEGYDIILTSETIYSPSSMLRLLNLMTKCLKKPHGIIFLAAKKFYFGVGGGTRQFCALVQQQGILQAKLIAEFVDGSSNVREIWQLSCKISS